MARRRCSLPHAPRSVLLATSFVLFLGVAPTLSAQVDLPKGARETAEKGAGKRGLELPRKQQNKLRRQSGEGEGRRLELPDSEVEEVERDPELTPDSVHPGVGDSSAPDPLAGNERPTQEVDAPRSAPTFLATQPALEEAARAVFERVSTLRKLDNDAIDGALAELHLFGPSAVVVARGFLGSIHGPTVLVAGRLLLSRGGAEERGAVIIRIDERLPAGVGERLVRMLANVDPVAVDPGVLISWLDHPSGEVRRAVERVVTRRVDPSWIPYLVDVMGSERTDTRARALELLGEIDHPTATNVIFDRISDPSSKVARRAVEMLALGDNPGLDDRLLAAAFENERGPLTYERSAAYALLALIEREDLQHRIILGEESLPALFEALRSPEELAVGAAACALAGIGFRSGADETGWLDLEVPHFLVRVVSGAVFHTDFGSLREPAERRLELLSGLSYGNQGPLWQEWWARVAGNFVARRAVLRVAPEEVDRLRFILRAEDGARPIAFLGPLVPDPGYAAVEYDVGLFFLRSDEMRDFDALLRREGIYGSDFVPAAQADAEQKSAFLEVRLESRGKRLAPARGAVWFKRVNELAAELAGRNSWQRFSDPRHHPTQHAFFAAESVWWSGERTPEECARRRRELVLDHLEGALGDPDLAALQALAAEPDAARAEDFPRLVACVRRLDGPGDSLALLVSLALDAAPSAAPSASDRNAIDPALAQDLFALVLGRFYGAARAVAREVLISAPAELALEESRASDPMRREVAALALGESESSEARARLLVLLEDPAESVRAAAVSSLGPWLDDNVADTLVQLARGATPRVRIAAFGVLASRPDRAVTDLLIVALADRDAGVVSAACQALAIRRDPESIPVLIAVFARGPSFAAFSEARHALESIGIPAVSELLRMTVTGSSEVQREAGLLLARLGEPAAIPVLLTLLTLKPEDGRVSHELAVLSCADFRGRADAVDAWWEWWDLVVHDDSLPWLLAAAHLRGLSTPPTGAWPEDGGDARDPRVLEFLVETALVEGAVGERARREIALRFGVEVSTPPVSSDERVAWRRDLVQRSLEPGR